MKRRSLARPLVKSLAFILVTVLATGLLALSIGRFGSRDTVSYKARFTDASGLRDGDGVRIAGVEVGRVEDIDVVDRRTAEVTFAVERGRELPATATATIRYLNLIGQRYVALERGTGAAGALERARRSRSSGRRPR